MFIGSVIRFGSSQKTLACVLFFARQAPAGVNRMTGIGREQHATRDPAEHDGAGSAGAGQTGNSGHHALLTHDLTHLHELLVALRNTLGRSLDLAGRGYCCTCNPIEDAATVTLSPGRNLTSASSATHQPPTEVHPHENLSGK